MSIQEDYFSDIADAIRQKSGSVAQIQASAFPTAIQAIPGGGSVGLVNINDRVPHTGYFTSGAAYYIEPVAVARNFVVPITPGEEYFLHQIVAGDRLRVSTWPTVPASGVTGVRGLYETNTPVNNYMLLFTAGSTERYLNIYYDYAGTNDAVINVGILQWA